MSVILRVGKAQVTACFISREAFIMFSNIVQLQHIGYA